MLSPKPEPPFPGGEHVQMIDTGPQGVSPGATRVTLSAVGDGGPGPLLPRVTRAPKKRKPVLPTVAELATLPRTTRAAFAARCALRVEPLVQLDTTADAAGAAAVAILRAAPEPWALQFIRRDFDRVWRLAQANGWTDDTPVPPEVFGPLWPAGRVPKWATEATEPKG